MIADEPGDEEVWAVAGSQPRFRSDAGEWGEGDFDLGDEGDDTTAMGSLVDVPEVDEEKEFAAEVAARRAPARRTRTKAPRSARSKAAPAAAAGAAVPDDR